MKKLKEKLALISPLLNEKQRRMVFAAEAQQLGRGGKTIISTLTGVSRPTLNRGLQELHSESNLQVPIKVRQSGAGRKKRADEYPELKDVLDSLVEPLASGCPESALRWTIKSCQTLSNELIKMGYNVGKTTVSHLLSELGYSLQSNQKGLERENQPKKTRISLRMEFQQKCKCYLRTIPN